MRPEKSERNKRIVTEWKNGATFRKIGEIYNISGPAVYKIVTRHRLKNDRLKRQKVR